MILLCNGISKKHHKVEEGQETGALSKHRCLQSTFRLTTCQVRLSSFVPLPSTQEVLNNPFCTFKQIYINKLELGNLGHLMQEELDKAKHQNHPQNADVCHHTSYKNNMSGPLCSFVHTPKKSARGCHKISLIENEFWM
jgi:hypothetical protein